MSLLSVWIRISDLSASYYRLADPFGSLRSTNEITYLAFRLKPRIPCLSTRAAQDRLALSLRMAPNKKKRTNKKKINPPTGTRTGGGRAGGSAGNRNKSEDNLAKALRDVSNIPPFRHDADRPKGVANEGFYQIYKRATARFWNWMKESLPNSRMKAVNDLKRGVDKILETNISSLESQERPPSPTPVVAPKEIMSELNTSIKYRDLFSTDQFGDGGGDDGHAYMVDTLKYCRSVLRFGQVIAKVAYEDSDESDTDDANEIGGRFSALAFDDDETENDVLEQESIKEMEEEIRRRNFRTFEAPETPEQDKDIEEDLINGTDRFKAVAFLHTMDQLMGIVEQHYGLLKRFLRGQDMHQGNAVQLVLECAAVANLATQVIHSSENELALSNPHISSFYHVLALVFLPSSIASIEKMTSPEKTQRDPHVGLDFVANIVECSFHNRGEERIQTRVKRFVSRTGIPYGSLEVEAKQIHILTSLETQLEVEKSMNFSITRLFRSGGCKPHTWLRRCGYIGGDQCILNTHTIVQRLLDVINEQKTPTKLIGRPGYWGPSFDEESRPAMRIRGDLDELFAGQIMPELIEICRQAPFSCLPERSLTITLIDLLHRHIRGDLGGPVPVALTFGLHSMLTSIFVLQGDKDLARVASITKSSYNTLFAQLDSVSSPSRSVSNAPNFYTNVSIFKQIVNFAQPVKVTKEFDMPVLDPTVTERFSFWNPLIGGNYLLYATYVCSIGLGSATVDSMGQLRFALHLYNALRQQEAIATVSFLKDLDEVFKACKAVWVSGRPDQGSYCKSFWIAWGMSISHASQLASLGTGSDGIVEKFGREQMTRDLDEILPEQFSASYRRVILQDFTDEEDVASYTLKNMTNEQNETSVRIGDLMTRINITRDAMDDDEDFVMPTNFTAVGCILLEFFYALSEHMGWDKIIDQSLSSMPEARTGKTMTGRRMRGFNASDTNMKCQGLAHIWATVLAQLDAGGSGRHEIPKIAVFMANYFDAIPKERYTFFTETEQQPRPRNPLEGSYPYGRTGKTADSPLHAFCHFKYSKMMRPVVRMIKPGKNTPFEMSSDGEIMTPYREEGSKVRMLPNGKFRHIASYSLDELIDLGWDGAMYVSTQAKHAANGHYVPFVPGYDSDADDQYGPIDIQAGKRAGVIGLPADENGRYMLIPNPNDPDDPQLVTIRNAR